ncbi:F-box domain-containing protein [Mycena indigotica]|uniref:F-box domain-containing protein n=1 Tax=Mycena indigotica TaxID=2126181 RepID=A0A8H6T1I2_9AGAR|nr:F-box domain-containing protein [Mycena indigotica]KAF7309321.1 F-box domain-containing protein [Mycena indigotica]
MARGLPTAKTRKPLPVLPNELLMLVFRMADRATLNAVALVSRAFHELSMEAHVTALAWKSQALAESNIVFWRRHNHAVKLTHVKRLALCFGRRRDIPEHTTAAICNFIPSFTHLQSLFMVSTALPDDFFFVLARLERLTALTLSSCAIPEISNTPHILPAVTSLRLSYPVDKLTGRHEYVQYFFSFFPRLSTLATDSLQDDEISLTQAQAAQLVFLNLGSGYSTGSASNTIETWYESLQRFDFPVLRRISVISPSLYHHYTTNYVPLAEPSKPFPALEDIFGPLVFVEKFAAAAPKLSRVAVQNALTKSVIALRFVESLAAHPLRRLAIILTTWDPDVFARIAELHSGLERLEVLYYQGTPSEKFMREVGTIHLPKFSTSGLKVLHLYALPTAPSDCEAYFSSQRWHPVEVQDRPRLTFAKLRRFVEAWGGAAPTLKRVRLGREPWKTWVRDDNFDWEQRRGEQVSTRGWGSVRQMDRYLANTAMFAHGY